MPGPEDRLRDGNLDRRGQIKRRYDRRYYYLCGERVPVGLGEPVFGKLHAALGHAMLTINAVKGFEYGDGFNAAFFRGSERNDRFFNGNGHINTRTNNSGGIQGGISNGQDIYFRVAFKSVATILMEQETVNMEGEDTILKHADVMIHAYCLVRYLSSSL